MDAGRKDAAPRKQGAGPNAGVPASSFRSENNFGTSAQVPGDPGNDGGQAAGDGGGGGGDVGTQAASDFSQAATSLDTGDPNVPSSYFALALIAVVGVLLGVSSVRGRDSG